MVHVSRCRKYIKDRLKRDFETVDPGAWRVLRSP